MNIERETDFHLLLIGNVNVEPKNWQSDQGIKRKEAKVYDFAYNFLTKVYKTSYRPHMHFCVLQ